MQIEKSFDHPLSTSKRVLVQLHKARNQQAFEFRKQSPEAEAKQGKRPWQVMRVRARGLFIYHSDSEPPCTVVLMAFPPPTPPQLGGTLQVSSLLNPTMNSDLNIMIPRYYKWLSCDNDITLKGKEVYTLETSSASIIDI